MIRAADWQNVIKFAPRSRPLHDDDSFERPIDVARVCASQPEKYLRQAIESDTRFLQLFDDAPDAIVQVDALGVIVLANRTAEGMFGYSRTELLGSNVD